MEKHQIFQVTQLLLEFLIMSFLYAVKYYFYKRFLGFKCKPWCFLLCASLLTFVDFYTMKTLSLSLRIIMGDVIWLTVICFLCKGNLLIKIYAVIIEQTVLLLINLTLLTFDFKISPNIHNINMSFNEHITVGFIYNIINALIRFAILFIFLRIICSFLDLKEKSMNLYKSLYLLIPCLSIYGLALIFYITQEVKIDDKNYYLPYIFPKLYSILPFVSFTLLMSILITAYTFKKMLEGEQQQQKNMLMEQQFKLQLTHSKNIEGLYTGIRSIMHDMNNHLVCLKNLAADNNVDNIKKYLDNIGETISKVDFKIKTGNPISDAVINEKFNIAKAEGIEFICDFMIPKETFLEPVDLCIILSNILDNAIEACTRISDNNITKKICIKSYIRDMYLIIEASNTTIHKIQYDKDKIISTKSDRDNHGIGISNIKTAVKKYNGVVDILEEKNKFIINIMLKIK